METGVDYRTVRLTAADIPVRLTRVAAMNSIGAIAQGRTATGATTTEAASTEVV